MKAQLATRFLILSKQEYRAAEEIGSQKHEWFEGEFFPVLGGTNQHNILVGNIYSTAKNAVRGTTFRARNSEQRVKVAATGLETYPDAVIFELPGEYIGRGESTLLNPRVLFEVLSASTEKCDRRGKWEQYKRIESFTDYVLIDQDSVSVEHFSRDGEKWNFRLYIRRIDGLELESVGFPWPWLIFTKHLMCPNRC